MKGYFLLKKRKIIHKGKTKVIEQSFNNINKDNNLNTNKESNIKSIIIKEGFGIILWEDKSELHSFFINNKTNGISKYIDPINKIIFEGEYYHNSRIWDIYKFLWNNIRRKLEK